MLVCKLLSFPRVTYHNPRRKTMFSILAVLFSCSQTEPGPKPAKNTACVYIRVFLCGCVLEKNQNKTSRLQVFPVMLRCIRAHMKRNVRTQQWLPSLQRSSSVATFAYTSNQELKKKKQWKMILFNFFW